MKQDSDSDDRKKKKKGKQPRNKQKVKGKEVQKDNAVESLVEESKLELPKNSNETPKQVSISQFKCSVCQEDFKTRNQLFKHIQTTGHAVPLPDEAKPSKRKTKQINK